MPEYKTVKIERSGAGWGGPLYITPTAEKPYIACCTGMAMHKVAKEIAKLSGGELRDAFRNPPPYDQMACIVTDCGGTARCEMYPSNNVPTICVFPISPPANLKVGERLSELFITGINKPKCVSLVDTDE